MARLGKELSIIYHSDWSVQVANGNRVLSGEESLDTYGCIYLPGYCHGYGVVMGVVVGIVMSIIRVAFICLVIDRCMAWKWFK